MGCEAFLANPVDVTLAAATVNPPSVKIDGITWFSVVDALGNSTLNNITIDFVTAGDNFHGSSSNYLLDTDLAHARFVYINSTIGWILS